MTKKLALAALAVVVLGGLGATAVTLLSGPGEVRFAPSAGDQRDYRVELHATMQEGDGEPSAFNTETLTVQSLMRYRVDAAGPTLKLHLDPRFMRAEDSRRTLFSSARPDDLEGNPIAPLMSAGFDLIMNRDGRTRLVAGDRSAWDRISEHAGRTPIDQLRQQMVAPAVPLTLPAREGAQATVARFQGMPALRLTVTDVDRDSIAVDLARADDAPVERRSVGPAGSDTYGRITHVTGRMRLARDSGWIQSLALISDQRIERFGQTVTVHTALSMTADDDPTTGAAADSLQRFVAMGQVAQSSDGYPLRLPQSADDAIDRPLVNAAKKPFAHANADFSVDADDNALVLTIEHHLADGETLGQRSLEGVTLRDADGQTLDIPLVLDSIGTDYDNGRATVIRLLPLGWRDPKLARVAGVEATLGYRLTPQPAHVQLPLADEPTEIHAGPAVARALPMAGPPRRWRILLSGNPQRFYTYDMTQSFAGLSARLTGRAFDDALSVFDRTLLQRVDDPQRGFQQIVVEGDNDAFGLALFSGPGAASEHRLAFRDRGLRYSDRDLPPPETHHLRLGATPATAQLDDIAPRGAYRNQLRLTLPRGVGAACTLTAEAPALDGHALVWRRAFDRHPDFTGGGNDPDATTVDWLLMTDDGVRVYFYGIDVDTRLRCPGRPTWQTRAAAGPDDKPWLVDIAESLGHDVDPATPAERFFRGTRFLDADDEPLRPMRRGVTADERLAAWSRESADATLADYLADDGTIRFWGEVASVRAITFTGAPIERRWHDRLEDLQ